MDNLKFALSDHFCLYLRRSLIAFGIIVALTTFGCGDEDNDGNPEILGYRPDFSNRVISAVSNEDAIGTRIWVPGLDDGYIPQGMTFAGDQILVGVYKSTQSYISEGQSKVFCVDPFTGEITGQFDLPQDIGHASGLASAERDILYVADSIGLGSDASGKIFKLDLKKAMDEGHCEDAILGEIILEGLMTPCYLTYDGRYLWFGTYGVEGSESPKIYKVDPDDVFDAWPSVRRVYPDMAVFSLDVEMWVQGAAFDREGDLWLSQSTSHWGCILKIDTLNGEILEEHELMAGIEGLAMSPYGELWSVSEAGAKKYYSWDTYYPLIFEIDVTRLKE